MLRRVASEAPTYHHHQHDTNIHQQLFIIYQHNITQALFQDTHGTSSTREAVGYLLVLLDEVDRVEDFNRTLGDLGGDRKSLHSATQTMQEHKSMSDQRTIINVKLLQEMRKK